VAGLSQYLWELEQPAHAVANGYFMAASNRVGTEGPWEIGEFYGNSYICNPRGEFLVKASSAAFDTDPATGEKTFTAKGQDELIHADCDLDMIEEVRKVWQFFRDRRPETYGDMIEQLP
jgi:beta-ureidopropionase